jgi:hypothetical protein
MSLFDNILPRGGDGGSMHVPGLDAVRTFAREGFSKSPTVTIPRGAGKTPIRFSTDRVRARPALTPTLSGALGMGAIGLGLWGLLAPRSVRHFLGIPKAVPVPLIQALFGVRELVTGYTLAGDPTKSQMLWTRVMGDAFDLAVLGALATPMNKKAHNARGALKFVMLVTVLDVIAAVRMTDVQRNCPASTNRTIRAGGVRR